MGQGTAAYELIKEDKLDYLIDGSAEGGLRLEFVPAKRQRVTKAMFNFAELEVIGTSERGKRLASKPVSRVTWLKTATSIQLYINGRKL